MEIIQTAKKGKYMNSIEKYHIYCTHKEGKQMKYCSISKTLYSTSYTITTEINENKPHYKRAALFTHPLHPKM
jgi:hypothetical protein